MQWNIRLLILPICLFDGNHRAKSRNVTGTKPLRTRFSVPTRKVKWSTELVLPSQCFFYEPGHFSFQLFDRRATRRSSHFAFAYKTKWNELRNRHTDDTMTIAIITHARYINLIAVWCFDLDCIDSNLGCGSQPRSDHASLRQEAVLIMVKERITWQRIFEFLVRGRASSATIVVLLRFDPNMHRLQMQNSGIDKHMFSICRCWIDICRTSCYICTQCSKRRKILSLRTIPYSREIVSSIPVPNILILDVALV